MSTISDISQAHALAADGLEQPVRQDLIEHVRAEVAAGTYESDAKIDAILDDLPLRFDLAGKSPGKIIGVLWGSEI